MITPELVFFNIGNNALGINFICINGNCITMHGLVPLVLYGCLLIGAYFVFDKLEKRELKDASLNKSERGRK